MNAAAPAYPAAGAGIAAAVQVRRSGPYFASDNASTPPGEFWRVQIRQGFVQHGVMVPEEGIVGHSGPI